MYYVPMFSIAFHSTGFMRDDNTDSSSIDKARLQGLDDDISGNSNDSGLHSRDFSSKSGTLSSFVWDKATIKQSDPVTFKTAWFFYYKCTYYYKAIPLLIYITLIKMAIFNYYTWLQGHSMLNVYDNIILTSYFLKSFYYAAY